MLNYVKRRIGIRLFIVFTAVLCASIFFVVTFSILHSRDFGTLVISENEKYVTSEALDFLAEITDQRAEKYEATFQKLSAYARLIATQAELRFQFEDSHPEYTIDVSKKFSVNPQNGLLYNDLSDPLAIIYWGGASISAAVEKEINLLAPLAPVFFEAKEKNSEVVASHMITTSGLGIYYPNGEGVLLLPPVSDLDLRDTNNYVLANPRNNPERKTLWVPVYFDDAGHGLITTVTSPVYGKDGAFLGVAGLDVPLVNIRRQIFAGSIEAEKKKARGIFSFLLDSRGKIIAFPMDQLGTLGLKSGAEEFKNSFDLLNIGLMDSSLPEVRTLGERILSSPMQTSRIMLQEVSYLSSSKVLPTNGWRLVTVIPEETFLAPIRRIEAALSFKIESLRGQFYLTALLFLFASLFLTILFLKRFFLKPLQQISVAAEQIKNGNLDTQLDLSRVDEIGSLASSFNVMVESLRRSKKLEQNYAQDLENQVATQTFELQRQKMMLEQTLLELEADILRRKKIESELNRARQDAEAANQAKSNFLANMTHELRTPLIGVLGMNELLLQTPLAERQKSLAVTVQRSGETLLTLISDILDFSKIESGHLSLVSVAIDLSGIVEETTLLLAEKAARKGLALICEVAPEARWEVSADPLRFRQIILNLLSNAVKFTSQGEVIVRLNMVEQENGSGRFSIEVEDTGIGMKAKDKEEIFAPFVQVDSTAMRTYGGTGLGLSIVRQLVHAMGGELGVESRVGEGSLFRVDVTLPLLLLHEPKLPEEFANRRVLLQEDNQSKREALQQMLNVLGVQVVGVTTGEDAWQRLMADRKAENPFDIILVSSESRMPEGSLLYEKIHQEQSLSGVPLIILCTRLAMQEDRYSSDLSLLEEPVIWDNLLAAFARCFGIARPNSIATEKIVPQRIDSIKGEGLSGNSGRTRGRILVADDYHVTRELVFQLLEKENLDIEEATSGTEVLSMTNNVEYGLVLMDCNMPGMDGMETTELLRKQGYSAPVVAMTAHIDSRIYEECRAVGMNDHLSKPFRYNELKKIIDKWLPIKET